MTASIDRVVPYEGNDPYIFISYSHKDTDRVMPVIRVLKENGFRVWYDEGIDPGSEWPESIAQHLNGSTVCIYFISENSLQSNNCKREVNFALSKNKGFLSIVLEPVEMSLGLELQIATYMSLIRYKYASEKQFIDKLIGVDLLKPCRMQMPEEETAEKPAEEPVKQPEPVSEKPAEEIKPVKKERRVKAERPAKKEKTSVRPSAKTGKIVMIALLAVSLVFFAVKIISGMSGPKKEERVPVIIGEQEVYDNTLVQIENQTLTAADMDTVAALQKVYTLRFFNCSFEGDSLQKLSALTNLNEIRLENCKGVNSLAFTGSMEKLKDILVRWCGITDDILSTLVLRDTFHQLNLRGNELTALPDLSVCPGLTVLNIRENSITSLEPIRTCTKLKELYAGSNQITDFSILEPMIYLTTVDVANNGVTSLDFLKNTTLLKEVDFSGNTELTDLSILSRNAETLESATLEYLSQADLSVLAACKNLKVLDITACDTDDVSFVRDMRGLETLQAAGNRIHYLSPLFECRGLKLINLAYNDISSLTGFPPTLTANYWYLYLQHNHLETLDGLTPSENGTVLALQGNPLQNIDALQNTKVSDVVLDYTPNLDKEVLNRSLRVYVTSVDLSEQVALEKGVTSQLYLLNEEEAMAKISERYNSVHPVFP